MIVVGIVKVLDYLDLEEEYKLIFDGIGQMELEEDVDIEICDEEFLFLVGQIKQFFELLFICVVKVLDGFMNCVVMVGINFVKERKEMKQQEVEEQQ